jgi:hypothetical protein
VTLSGDGHRWCQQSGDRRDRKTMQRKSISVQKAVLILNDLLSQVSDSLAFGDASKNLR